MLEYDTKYLRLLSQKLDRFTQKDTNLFNFRCPVCGDSQKNPYKARGYAFLHKGGLTFKCHNCGASMGFPKFLKFVDDILYKEYVMERFKSDTPSDTPTEFPTLQTQPILPDVDLDTLATRVTDLDPFHPAVKFLRERKIPTHHHDDLWVVEDTSTLAQLNPDVYEGRLSDRTARVVVPYRSTDRTLVGVTARTLGGSTLRYVNVKVTDDPMIWGLDRVDTTKTIYVTEGAFDGMFLPNSVSASGSDLKKVETVLPTDRLVYVYDNEPRSPEILTKILSTIENGRKIFIPPKSMKVKDLNDLVRTNFEVDELPSFINKHTFDTLHAMVKFNEWKKIWPKHPLIILHASSKAHARINPHIISPMNTIIKRNGHRDTYDQDKIIQSLELAMSRTDFQDVHVAKDIAHQVTQKLFHGRGGLTEPTANEIHDLVENILMDNNLNAVAKEYILYRNSNKPNIFRKRVALKPYEYPELEQYVEAIRHSYWVHTEFNYNADIQDIAVTLNEHEKEVVVRAMLAISQIEVAVKSFWGDIYKRMPKPEIGSVGATFAESEVRHADAYSNLLKLVGLNDEFEKLMDIPVMRRRIKYLEKAIVNSKVVENREYFESVILFSMFVENVSLFSQFLVIMSFNKFKNALKGISNAVEATSKEEQIHAEFGFDLINTIKTENPNWWTEQLVEDLKQATLEAYEAEKGIVEWIFESGDLDFLSKHQCLEFIKNRFNQSLNQIGIDPLFEVEEGMLETTEWFDDEILATKHTDFFNKRSINYTKRQQSVTENDLF